MRGWWRSLHQTHPLLARMLPLVVGVVASLVFVLPVVQPIEHVAPGRMYHSAPDQWAGVALAVVALLSYGRLAGNEALTRSGLTTAVLVSAAMFMSAAPTIPWAAHVTHAVLTVDVDEAMWAVCEYNLCRGTVDESVTRSERDHRYRVDVRAQCAPELINGSAIRRYAFETTYREFQGDRSRRPEGSPFYRAVSYAPTYETWHQIVRSGEALSARGLATRRPQLDPIKSLLSHALLGCLLGLVTAALMGVMPAVRTWESDDDRRLARLALIGGIGGVVSVIGAVVWLELSDGPVPGVSLGIASVCAAAAASVWLFRAYRADRIHIGAAVVWPLWAALIVALPTLIAHCMRDAGIDAGHLAAFRGTAASLLMVALVAPAVAVANRRWAVMPR